MVVFFYWQKKMAGREVTYSVKLDTSSAKSQASQLAQVFQEELKSLDLKLDLSAAQSQISGLSSSVEQVAQAQQQVNQATQQQASAVGQVAQAENTVAQAAQQAAQAQTEITQAARQTEQVIEQTAKTQRQAAQEARQQAQASKSSSGGGGGIGGALTGALAGYLTIQGARQIAQQAEQFAELGTEVRRTELAFTTLSGGAQQAQANLAAVKEASGGAITNLRAMEVAQQAAGLGLATTATQLGELTQAGREISLISPSIHDIGDAVQFLDQASAGLRYRSLIQLGLTADSVKAKMAALQAQNAGMTDQQAFLASSIELLNSKYGTLLQSTDAQASGVEKLKVAFGDLYATLAAGATGRTIDGFFGDMLVPLVFLPARSQMLM